MSDQNEIVVKVDTALVESGLSEDGIVSLKSSFEPHFSGFNETRGEALQVQENEPKKAREIRLKLKNIRVAADKTRKALKEDSLRRGRAIDGMNNILLAELKPLEERMDDIEKAEERREAERIRQLVEQRAELIREYADPEHYKLAEMDDEAFSGLLGGLKKAKAEREEQERLQREKEERERKEREEREAKLKAENERLRKEKEEADRVAAEKAEQERKAREEQEAQLKAEREAREKAERDARKAEEERQQEIRRIEEEKQAEIRKREAQEQAERERLEKERKARESAPDVEKVRAFCDTLSEIVPPALSTNPELQAKIHVQHRKYLDWLNGEALKMEQGG